MKGMGSPWENIQEESQNMFTGEVSFHLNEVSAIHSFNMYLI